LPGASSLEEHHHIAHRSREVAQALHCHGKFLLGARRIGPVIVRSGAPTVPENEQEVVAATNLVVDELLWPPGTSECELPADRQEGDAPLVGVVFVEILENMAKRAAFVVQATRRRDEYPVAG
jgi:hypothetical protein